MFIAKTNPLVSRQTANGQNHLVSTLRANASPCARPERAIESMLPYGLGGVQELIFKNATRSPPANTCTIGRILIGPRARNPASDGAIAPH